MMTRLVIAGLYVLSCSCSSWAQPYLEGFVHDEVTLASSLSSALGYDFAQVVCQDDHQRTIGLSPQQSENIRRMQLEFAERFNRLLSRSLGVEVGEHIELDVVEASRRQEPYRPEIERQEREFEQQLRAQLSPMQIEAAEAIVMRERYRTGGLRAVLASTDIPALSKLGFERPPAEIKERLDASAREAYKDVEELHQKLNTLCFENFDKVQEIALRQIQSALDKLGGDGATIQALLARLSDTSFTVSPDDGSMSSALKYSLVRSIIDSLDKNRFELTDEQRQQIESLYRPFIERRNRLLGMDTEIFGIPDNLVGPALLERHLREERNLAQKMRAMMTAEQIEAAELSVLRQRYSQAGLRAVLESSDLDLVNTLRFERPLAEIKAHIAAAVAKPQFEIDSIHAESAKAGAECARQIERIDQQALDAALRQLGSDGEKLRELMDQWK